MKTLAGLTWKVGMPLVFVAVVFGCTASTPDRMAADARVQAAEASTDVVNANARVAAAYANGKAAEEDAIVDVLAGRRPENKRIAKALIPGGTLLKVFLIDAIDSNTSSAGDRFLAILAAPVVVDGATVLPKGTRVRGHVIHAAGAGKLRGPALLRLELTDIVQRNNRMLPIATGTLEASADAMQTREAEVLAGGARIEAKGKEIHYSPETLLDFTLTKSVEL